MFKIVPDSQKAVAWADRINEINYQDDKGKTIAMRLIEENDIHAAALAIDCYKADLNIKDKDGKIAFDYANELECHPLFKEITKPKPQTPSASPAKTTWQKLAGMIGIRFF